MAMARWHRETDPISAAIELASVLDQTERVHVTGKGHEFLGNLREQSINVSRGDVESYADFEIVPPQSSEPITEKAERHVVRVNIFDNETRDDVSDVTAIVRPLDADMSDTVVEFAVRSFEVIDELHRPELLVNEDFDPNAIEDPSRQDRLRQVDEMVREEAPYYLVLNEIGAGKVMEPPDEGAVSELIGLGYVRERASGMYELTPTGERMHQAFADYIYGTPG